MLGTVSDDNRLLIHDTRSLQSPIHDISAHEEPINSLGFSQYSHNLIATASADKTIGLWDLRNLSQRLHTFLGHGESVTSVYWDPRHDGILASAGNDRRVIIWDVSRIGEEQTQDDAEDGAPELLFMHGGHTSPVSDISWNPDADWTVASVSEDNIIQIWKPSKKVVGGEPEVIDIDLE